MNSQIDFKNLLNRAGLHPELGTQLITGSLGYWKGTTPALHPSYFVNQGSPPVAADHLKKGHD